MSSVKLTYLKEVDGLIIEELGSITLTYETAPSTAPIQTISVNGVEQPIEQQNVDIEVPTKTSELTNDSGFISEEADPTVPAWAKEPTKPTYTANDVGASPSNHNHSLANLTEKSYNSLTDKPNLTLLEDVVDVNTWLNSVLDLQPPIYEGQIAYIADEKYLLTAIEETIEEITQLNWYLLDFHWKVYVNKDVNSDFYGKLFIYNGIELVVVPDSLVLGETSSTAFDGLRGKAAYDHSQTTGNPHGTTIDNMTNGAATTVASGDSFFLKVGNIWKTITESNFLSWFRGLSHTWSLIQDFAAGLKTDSITKRNGSGLYALQDGGTIWHTAKWFTPTGTFTSVGTTVTTTGGQLTSAMVGAKIGVGEDKRVITAFLTSNTCTVDSSYSQDYSGVVSGSWGVYSLVEYYTNGKKVFKQINGNIFFTIGDGDYIESYKYLSGNAIELSNSDGGLLLGNARSIRFSSDANYNGTKDTGLSRNAAGILEVNNGTAGTFRDLKLRNTIETGIVEYADNAAAVAAGLAVGTHYRTGDLLKIVH